MKKIRTLLAVAVIAGAGIAATTPAQAQSFGFNFQPSFTQNNGAPGFAFSPFRRFIDIAENFSGVNLSPLLPGFLR